jgi:hypothetical protein
MQSANICKVFLIDFRDNCKLLANCLQIICKLLQRDVETIYSSNYFSGDLNPINSRLLPNSGDIRKTLRVIEGEKKRLDNSQ